MLLLPTIAGFPFCAGIPFDPGVPTDRNILAFADTVAGVPSVAAWRPCSCWRTTCSCFPIYSLCHTIAGFPAVLACLLLAASLHLLTSLPQTTLPFKGRGTLLHGGYLYFFSSSKMEQTLHSPSYGSQEPAHKEKVFKKYF
jgi:hypothetical protein